MRTEGLVIDKNQTHKHRVHAGKLDDPGTILEHTPRKSLKLLAEETGVSTSSVRPAIQFLKLRPNKTIVIHARLAAT
jgi:hypothetical protein